MKSFSVCLYSVAIIHRGVCDIYLLGYIKYKWFDVVIYSFGNSDWMSCLHGFRPLPPLPSLDVSEEIVVKIADEMLVWVNLGLSIAHDIAIGGNLRLFCQVL